MARSEPILESGIPLIATGSAPAEKNQKERMRIADGLRFAASAGSP